MRSYRLVWGFIAFSIPLFSALLQAEVFAQVQDFESNFEIVNHPDEFIPFWSANEVRSTAARVFQANGEGRNGSRALAVQPISTFDGEIFTSFDLRGIEDPKLAFFAKSRQNGAGNRPATVFISFGKQVGTYSHRRQIGEDETFPNQHTDYRLYEVIVPDLFWEEQVFVKIEVKYGPGTGSAARFFMDDFGVFPGAEQIDPVRIHSAIMLNPFELLIEFDREIEEFDLSQVAVSDSRVSSLSFLQTNQVILGFEREVSQILLNIQLLDIQDQGGQLTEEVVFELDHRKIQLGEVIIESPERVTLSFSQFYDPSSISQASKYRINGNPPNALSLLENGFSLVLNLAQQLVLGQEIKVEVGAVRNSLEELGEPSEIALTYLDGIIDLFPSSDVKLIIKQEEILDQNTLVASEFKVLESELTFSFEDSDQADQLNLIPSQPFEENVNYTLSIPVRRSIKGKLWHGSFRDFIWDATPPNLDQVLIVSNRELLLLFSEGLDPVYAGIISNYSINGFHPQAATLQENGYAVLLSWTTDFQNGETYTILVNNVADLAGNFADTLSLNFTYEAPEGIGFKSVLINEVMPAPRAGNSLPNVEYVELYNRSDVAINLGGFQLSNSRRTTSIPNEILLPEEYIILCPRTRIAEFTPYGRVIGLTNWPTLLNSADQVKLWDARGQVIDSLNYSTASFGGSSFASGGYSLEIVNPFIDCNLSNNLKVSISPQRGTPGQVNSVFDESPDRTAPKIVGTKVLNPNRLEISFSKVLSPNLQVLSFEFTPQLQFQTVSLSQDQMSLILLFESEISEGIKYQGKVNGLRDCIGNEVGGGENSFTFTKPSAPDQGDIVINEVLFNARAGGPKFVEVYNQSDKFINLKDWKLANLNSDGEISNRRLVATSDLILDPYGFLVFTTDAGRLYAEYPKGKRATFVELNSLPSYPQSQGNVVWLDPEEVFPEIFAYSERMHHRLLREPRGVSLERLNAKSPVDQSDNWQSASASVGFASPGMKNSNTFDGSELFGIEISPKVFVPDAAGEQNFTTISYQVEQPGMLATLRIFATNGALVREICQNEIWGTQGFYIWDGTDSAGRKVRAGYYVLIADVFDMDGNVSQTKKTVVVGSKIR